MKKFMAIGLFFIGLGVFHVEYYLHASNCSKLQSTLGCNNTDTTCKACDAAGTKARVYFKGTMYLASGTGNVIAGPAGNYCYRYADCVYDTTQYRATCAPTGAMCIPADPPAAGVVPECKKYKAGTFHDSPANDHKKINDCGEG